MPGVEQAMASGAGVSHLALTRTADLVDQLKAHQDTFYPASYIKH